MTGEIKKELRKKIPYGLSAYGDIRKEHYYYVDKTAYLETIENFGKFIFFIRPRRFGKSLFMTMMTGYYDIYYKDRFDEFFKGTWVYDHPTAERHQYLILSLNFSVIEPDLSTIKYSFVSYVRKQARDFISKYQAYFSTINQSEKYARDVEESQSANDILVSLINLCKGASQKLYIIIDEYDHFTNNILVDFGPDAYFELTRGAGFLRAFFNVLKAGTTHIEASISRLFISGVSPVTMDDVTSGFNIGKNISIEPAVNAMLGFSREDVTEMIEYYRSFGLIKHPTDFLLELINQWYGNYQFAEYGHDLVRMFNSDMVLYFVDNYLTKQGIPLHLIDDNVKIDYGKLRHLIIIDNQAVKTLNGNFNKLKEIISDGGTSANLVKSFPLDKLLDTNNFNSLLFYFGLVTIKGPDKDKLRLIIPNLVARNLYYKYIEEAYRETGIYSIDLSRYADLMTNLAYDGQWQPLFDYIFSRMKESMSLRDLITGEKAIQAFLNVYLGLSDLYIIHVERELNKGYADLFMEPFVARYEGIQYAYLLELKYIAAGRKSDDPEVLKLKAEAETQIQRYTTDQKFKQALEKTTLIKLIVIFSGHEAVVVENV